MAGITRKVELPEPDGYLAVIRTGESTIAFVGPGEPIEYFCRLVNVASLAVAEIERLSLLVAQPSPAPMVAAGRRLLAAIESYNVECAKRAQAVSS